MFRLDGLLSFLSSRSFFHPLPSCCGRSARILGRRERAVIASGESRFAEGSICPTFVLTLLLLVFSLFNFVLQLPTGGTGKDKEQLLDRDEESTSLMKGDPASVQ